MFNFIRQGKSSYRPRLEVLEERMLLSELVLVTSRAGLGGNDYIDWGTLGQATNTVIPQNPFSILSSHGFAVSLGEPGGNFLYLVEGRPGPQFWNGNFSSGAHLLDTGEPSNPGPMAISFASPVFGGGAQIESDPSGPFVANINAFDANGVLLGSFTEAGQSGSTLDNSAIFLGVRSDTANIAKLQYSIVAQPPDPRVDFAINQFDFVTGSVDIAMTSAQLQNGNTVQFTYETTGNPGPFQVGLYASADGVIFDSANPILTQTVTPNPTNPQTPGTFTLPSGFQADPTKPYLLVAADPNKVIAESDDNNNNASFPLTDIAATSLTWNTTQGGVDFSYQVTGAELPQDTYASLYWASGPTENDIIDLASNPVTIPKSTPLDTPITEHIAAADLFTPPPQGATHLLLVVDPANLIDEGVQGEENNVKSAEFFNIKMDSFEVSKDDSTPALRRVIEFNYAVRGADLPQSFDLQVYRSANQSFDTADLTNGLTYALRSPVHLTGAEVTVGLHTRRITLPTQLSFDREHPFVLVVADPDDQINELDRTDNTLTNPAFDVSLPDPPKILRYYNQDTDGRNGNGELVPYLDTKESIKAGGCLLSDLAMALTYVGVNTTPVALNALLLDYAAGKNLWGRPIKAWSGDGDLQPFLATAVASVNAGQPEIRFHDGSAFQGDADTVLANLLQTERVPVIVIVPSQMPGKVHYVLVTGVSPDGKDFTILDPGHRDNNGEGLIAVFGRSFTVRGYVSDPTDDLSAFVAAAASRDGASGLLVVDTQGRRTGVDPATGEILTEIPGSTYSTDGPYDAPDGTDFRDVLRSILILQPKIGSYTVQIFSSVRSESELLLGATDEGGFVTPSVIESISAPAGSVVDFQAQFAADGRVIPLTNLPPNATISGPTDGVRNQPRDFTLTATDPSPIDQAAGFTFNINWGDGSTETVNGPSGMQVEHAYADSGSYIVQVTATDKDGGVSEVVSHNIAITAAALEDDPSDPGKTALVVGGTSGSDLIRFRPVHRSGAVEVFINHASQGTFTPTGRIIAYGGAGNDNIQVSDRIHLPAFLYGGPGNDFLLGGAGNNVLVGDDGNDILIGRGGRDVLIGGTGRDILIAGGGQDILIAGNTAFDSHDAALFLILSEWTSSRDYETRVANLRGEGNGPRANGDVFLKVGPNATVFDDGARDVLIGNRGRDWFFANLNSGVKDKIRHHLLGEFVDDPDFADAGI